MHTMRRLRVISLCVVSSIVMAACSSSPSPGALAGKSAGTVLRLALRDARAAGSMHFSIQTKGGVQQDAIGEISSQGGEAVMTSSNGVTRILVMGKTGYIESDAMDLQAGMGLSVTAAAANANKWITLTSAAAAFPQLANSVSFTSTLDEFTPGGKLSLAVSTIAGHTVGLIEGTGTATQAVTSYEVEMAVTTTSPVLPLAGGVRISANGKTVTQAAIFDQWGKRVTVKPPTGAVPLADIAPK